jgi:hypothetical protein
MKLIKLILIAMVVGCSSQKPPSPKAPSPPAAEEDPLAKYFSGLDSLSEEEKATYRKELTSPGITEEERASLKDYMHIVAGESSIENRRLLMEKLPPVISVLKTIDDQKKKTLISDVASLNKKYSSSLSSALNVLDQDKSPESLSTLYQVLGYLQNVSLTPDEKEYLVSVYVSGERKTLMRAVFANALVASPGRSLIRQKTKLGLVNTLQDLTASTESSENNTSFMREVFSLAPRFDAGGASVWEGSFLKPLASARQFTGASLSNYLKTYAYIVNSHSLPESKILVDVLERLSLKKSKGNDEPLLNQEQYLDELARVLSLVRSIPEAPYPAFSSLTGASSNLRGLEAIFFFFRTANDKKALLSPEVLQAANETLRSFLGSLPAGNEGALLARNKIEEILNTAPTLSEVTLTSREPGMFRNKETLTCSLSGSDLEDSFFKLRTLHVYLVTPSEHSGANIAKIDSILSQNRSLDINDVSRALAALTLSEGARVASVKNGSGDGQSSFISLNDSFRPGDQIVCVSLASDSQGVKSNVRTSRPLGFQDRAPKLSVLRGSLSQSLSSAQNIEDIFFSFSDEDGDSVVLETIANSCPSVTVSVAQGRVFGRMPSSSVFTNGVYSCKVDLQAVSRSQRSEILSVNLTMNNKPPVIVSAQFLTPPVEGESSVLHIVAGDYDSADRLSFSCPAFVNGDEVRCPETFVSQTMSPIAGGEFPVLAEVKISVPFGFKDSGSFQTYFNISDSHSTTLHSTQTDVQNRNQKPFFIYKKSLYQTLQRASVSETGVLEFLVDARDPDASDLLSLRCDYGCVSQDTPSKTGVPSITIEEISNLVDFEDYQGSRKIFRVRYTPTTDSSKNYVPLNMAGFPEDDVESFLRLSVEDGGDSGQSSLLKTSQELPLLVYRRNTPPNTFSASLSKTNFVVGDVLECVGTTDDADGDSLSYSYKWLNFNEGEYINLESLKGSRIVISQDLAHKSLSCSIEAFDGKDGQTLSTLASPVIVSNSPPSNFSPRVLGDVRVDQILGCDGRTTDPDGDGIRYTIAWREAPQNIKENFISSVINGSVSSTQFINSVKDGAGEWSALGDEPMFRVPASSAHSLLVCEISAEDDFLGGKMTRRAFSEILLVANTNPVISNVVVEPGILYVDDTAQCSVSSQDIDLDALAISYKWFLLSSDGIQKTTLGTSASYITITKDYAHKRISCEATAKDGYGGEAIRLSGEASVRNSPPTAFQSTIVSLGARPVVGSMFRCDADPVDPDGDTLSYTSILIKNFGGQAQELARFEGREFILPPSAAHQNISCLVLAKDPYGGETLSSTIASENVVNTSPSVSSIALDKTRYSVGDTARCLVTSEDIDEDSLQSSYSWRWRQDDNASHQNLDGAADSIIISPAMSHGLLSCVVSVFDGEESTSRQSAEVLIRNSSPVAPAPVVAQETPISEEDYRYSGQDSLSALFVGETAVCVGEGADPDLDILTYRYKWFRITPSGPVAIDTLNTKSFVVPPSYSKFQIQCEITVSDREFSVKSSLSAIKTISNSPPLIASVALSKQGAVKVGERLSCDLSVNDVDSDPFTTQLSIQAREGDIVSYSQNVTPRQEITVTNNFAHKNISCLAISQDNRGGIHSLRSNSVLYENSKPDVFSVLIDNESPVVGDVSTCSGTTTDPDMDELSYGYQWLIASPFSASFATLDDASSASLVISASMIGKQLKCVITASDGRTGRETAESVVFSTVNRNPNNFSASISPLALQTGSQVTCSGATTDSDHEGISPVPALQYSYRWERSFNGFDFSQLSQTESVLTIGPELSHQILRCSVIASDGLGGVTTSTASSSAEIQNTLHSQGAVTVSARQLPKDSSVECSFSAVDPDMDSLITQFKWEFFNQSSQQYNDIPGATSSVYRMANTYVHTNIRCVVSVEERKSTNTSILLHSASYVSETIQGVNQPPASFNASISPSRFAVNDNVSCNGTTQDESDSSLSYSISWFSRTSPTDTPVVISGQTSRQLTVTQSLAHKYLSCQIYASDASSGVLSNESSKIQVVNTVPVANSIYISLKNDPAKQEIEDFTLDEELYCNISLSDRDGDDLTVSYRWEFNLDPQNPESPWRTVDEPRSSPEYLVSSGQSHQFTRCSVQGSDTFGFFTFYSEPIFALNSAPQPFSAVLDKTTVQVGAGVICTGSTTDIDADTLVTSYAWEQKLGSNWVVIPGQSNSNISIVAAYSHTELRCRITIVDGYGGSTSDDTGNVLVINTAPATFSSRAALTSTGSAASSATVDDTLYCIGTTTDVNSDSISYSYSWFRQAVATPIASGASYPVDYLDKGLSLFCEITASDGQGGSTKSSSNLVAISRRGPTISLTQGSTNISVAENSTYTWKFNLAEPDGDGYNQACTGLPTFVTTTLSAGVLTVTASPTFAVASRATPTSNFTFSCSSTDKVDRDGSNNLLTQSSSISFSVTNVDRAPTISISSAPTTSSETTAVSITVSYADLDGDSILPVLIGGLTLDSTATGTISATTTQAQGTTSSGSKTFIFSTSHSYVGRNTGAGDIKEPNPSTLWYRNYTFDFAIRYNGDTTNRNNVTRSIRINDTDRPPTVPGGTLAAHPSSGNHGGSDPDGDTVTLGTVSVSKNGTDRWLGTYQAPYQKGTSWYCDQRENGKDEYAGTYVVTANGLTSSSRAYFYDNDITRNVTSFHMTRSSESTFGSEDGFKPYGTSFMLSCNGYGGVNTTIGREYMWFEIAYGSAGQAHRSNSAARCNFAYTNGGLVEGDGSCNGEAACSGDNRICSTLVDWKWTGTSCSNTNLGAAGWCGDPPGHRCVYFRDLSRWNELGLWWDNAICLPNDTIFTNVRPGSNTFWHETVQPRYWRDVWGWTDSTSYPAYERISPTLDHQNGEFCLQETTVDAGYKRSTMNEVRTSGVYYQCQTCTTAYSDRITRHQSVTTGCIHLW